jgi:hypothetical protein
VEKVKNKTLLLFDRQKGSHHLLFLALTKLMLAQNNNSLRSNRLFYPRERKPSFVRIGKRVRGEDTETHLYFSCDHSVISECHNV